MFAPGVVIYEKSRRWEAILKRYFTGTQVQIRPCRVTSQVLDVLDQMRGSVLVIDMSVGAAAGLRLVAQTFSRHPRSPIVTVASAALADLEWPAREFGVTAFLTEPIVDADLGRLCASQLEVLISIRTNHSTNESRFGVL